MPARLLVTLALTACGQDGAPLHVPPMVDAPAPIIECNCNIRITNIVVGCNEGDQCKWFVDQAALTPLGHVSCGPRGTVPIGGACTYSPLFPDTPGSCIEGSYDTCTVGGACWNGTCEQICDPQATPPPCAPGLTCVTRPDFLAYGGQPIAGLFEP